MVERQPVPKLPREGTYPALVLPYLKQGLLTPQIAQITGKKPRIISQAIAQINKHGYLVRTKEEKEKAKKEAIRQSRGSILPITETFIQMRLASLEIQFAVEITTGQVLPLEKTRESAKHYRGHNKQLRFTPAEIQSIRSENSGHRKEQTKARVGLWLDSAARLIQSQDPAPTTRGEWLNLIKKYQDESLISKDATHWLSVVGLYKRNGKKLPSDWSPQNIDQERQFVTAATVKEAQYINTLTAMRLIVKDKRESDLALMLNDFCGRKIPDPETIEKSAEERFLNRAWFTLERLYARNDREFPDWDEANLEEERQFIAKAKLKEEAIIKSVMGLSKNPPPLDYFDKSYLMDSYYAWAQNIQAGNRELVISLPKLYAKLDPEIEKRLYIESVYAAIEAWHDLKSNQPVSSLPIG